MIDNGLGRSGPTGPIPQENPREKVGEARLPSALSLFRLPPPPSGVALAEAVKASLRMVGVGPDHVTLPLYAAVWRAPLGPATYSLYLVGSTGSGKSTLAALAQPSTREKRNPMLDIHWLHAFVTLARLQHFGQTATELHMTQPNVSLHLKNLEQATRVKLVERSPFRLTQAGERLLQSAERAINELQLCQSDLNALSQLSQGTLAIAASDIISRLLLIQPFQRFKQAFPGIDLTLFNTTSDQAADLVRAGKADLGFVMAQKRSEPLFYTELQQVTWCALGHGLARWQARASSGDSDPLDEPTLILLGHDTRTRALIDPSLPLLGLPSCRIMEVGSVDAQLDWAEAGFGVAIVPDFSLHPRLKLTAPVTRLTDFPGTSLGYVVRQNQVLSRAIKQLLHWVEEEIQNPALLLAP